LIDDVEHLVHIPTKPIQPTIILGTPFLDQDVDDMILDANPPDDLNIPLIQGDLEALLQQVHHQELRELLTTFAKKGGFATTLKDIATPSTIPEVDFAVSN
jgi:uncharacterized protein (DUF2342 family)